MTRQENAVFVDASGRRRRLMRYASVVVGAACVCFVVIVLAGFFGAGPAGGPLPWSQSRQDPPPAADESTPSTGESREAADGKADAEAVSDATSPSASATSGSDASGSPGTGGAGTATTTATTKAPPAASPAASAPPGNSGNAPRRSPAADGKGPK
ncbi:hypothetical protein ACWGI8_00235 [Streptomyces sp. NPDC054841]